LRPDHETLLAGLAVSDEAAVESTVGTLAADPGDTILGARTRALVRLSALVALEPAEASFEWIVSVALAAGATDAEIVDVLVAVAPVVGLVRMSSAAAGLARALGPAIVPGGA
jgi:alkylhydroperoxidase/carboxymuconolactone decarboxylase family protein YurZ